MRLIPSLLITAAALVLLSCATVPRERLINKDLYLQANLWFERPMRIESTNYHRGSIIPAGTKARVLRVINARTSSPFYNEESNMVVPFGGEIPSPGILFEILPSGQRFQIIFISKHHTGLLPSDIAEHYFGKEDPLASARYAGFTPVEKEAIRQGTLEPGMSKDAVLMAYGYPPEHRTPSLGLPTWIYWTNRFVSKRLIFSKDGRVIEAW